MPQQTAVFMYSTAGPDGQTVTLQLRETDETIELPASMLSKMSRQTDTATLSISYQDSAEVLTDGTIDLLLATTPLHSSGKSPSFAGHDLITDLGGSIAVLGAQKYYIFSTTFF